MTDHPGMDAPPPLRPKMSGLAVTSFIISCLFFLPILPLVGAILGIVATARLAGRRDRRGIGLAIAAIPVGLVMTLFLQGILAAVAIPAFIKYIRKSKTTEATEGLHKIAAGARLYAGERGGQGFPAVQTGWTPKEPCCASEGSMCVPSPTDWAATPWRELGFHPLEKHYFQWRYTGGGRRFVVEARADLDCDGEYSSYRIQGELTEGGEVRIGAPQVSAELE